MLRCHRATPLSYISTVSAVDVCVKEEKAFELATLLTAECTVIGKKFSGKKVAYIAAHTISLVSISP